MITTVHTMSCDDCGKKFAYESKNRAGIAEAARKEGWFWKGAEVQYCSKCKTNHVKVAAPKAKKAAKGKAKAKKVVKKASVRKGPKVHEYGAAPASSEGSEA